jgi:effector-binding domain-containing protein
MKILKRILIVLLILIGLLLVISLFLPSKVHVERSIVIKAPANVVFAQVNSLKNWNNWSPWMKKDPKMVSTYEGPESGVGSKSNWTSEVHDVGKGNMSITESHPDSMIKVHMEFTGRGGADASFLFAKDSGGTKVTWSFDNDMGWNLPGRYAGLMMDKWLGPDFENGLKELKTVSEKAALSGNAINVEETTVPDMHALTLDVKCSVGQISAKFGESFGKLMGYMAKSGLKEAGAPFTIYDKYAPPNVEMRPGIPTDKPGKSEGDIKAVDIKGGNVLKVSYKGPYSKMMPVYNAIPEYAKAHHKEITGAPWEVYVTDPMTVKDSSQLQTDVYYPVK